MNYEYEEAPDLKKTARLLVKKFPELEHIDVDDVLFLWEKTADPAAFAKCYRLDGHPIGFFTPERFCIVVHAANCDYFTSKQYNLLLYHEMRHIGRKNTLIDHDVQDFKSVLKYGLDWHKEGAEVPNILGEEDAPDRF